MTAPAGPFARFHCPGRPWLTDGAVAAVVTAVQIGGTLLAGSHQLDVRPFDARAIALLAVGPLALAFRRRASLVVLGVNVTATFAYLLADYPKGPVFLGMIVALFRVMGTEGRRAIGWWTLGVGYVAFVIGVPLLRGDGWPPLASASGAAAWMLLLGGGIEVQRTVRERALAAAAAAEEEARRQASEERLRIARELHDVLAHNISLINVQAGVALHLLDSKPEQAGPALTAIKQASKEALGELRSVLDVLRGTDDLAPLAPTVGLDGLDDLIDGTRAAGLDVRLRVVGARRPLPAGVDLAAFRIVQEALTNVVRHAGPTLVTVEVRYGDDVLTVVVEDEGGTGGDRLSGPTPGNGIAGMRERAATLGGTLDAGPRPSHGFRVAARLPLAAAEAPAPTPVATP